MECLKAVVQHILLGAVVFGALGVAAVVGGYVVVTVHDATGSLAFVALTGAAYTGVTFGLFYGIADCIEKRKS